MTRCPFTRQECSSADKCAPPVTPLFVPVVPPEAPTLELHGDSWVSQVLDVLRQEPRLTLAAMSILGGLLVPRLERPLFRAAHELLRQDKEERDKKAGAP